MTNRIICEGELSVKFINSKTNDYGDNILFFESLTQTSGIIFRIRRAKI